MRKGLISILVMAAATQGAVSTTSAVSCTLSSCPGAPTLVPTFGGNVSPRKLPRNDYVPVTASLFGKVSTTDGTHPPALREAVVDIDKDVKVNVKGYPVCGMRELKGQGTKVALKNCRDSLVGEGGADVEIGAGAGNGLMPPSPLLVFNGGEKIALLIHTFITVPAPTAIVTTVTITRKGSGIHSVAKIPVIAGGSGSLLDFHFRLGKTYEYKGREAGYLEAKCPDGVFKLSFPELLFKNEAHTPGQDSAFNLKGALAVPCTPYG